MSINDELENIRTQLKNHEKRISKLETKPDEKSEVSKKLSIREFFISKKPKTVVDKALLVGYYFENYQGFSSFNVGDVENGFRAAKEPVPSNINDMMNKNIHKGFIMDAAEKKESKQAWVLTGRGLDYVGNDLKNPN
jgi:hypothetical protein